jgi:hypothetical protein
MKALLVIGIVAFAPSAAWAQAWLPQQGEATVSFVLTDVLVREHYLPTQTFDRGHIRTKTLIADVTYGLRDDLALSVALPVVRSKYSGTFPHPGGLDDGAAHMSVQDLRVDVRYRLTQGPLMVTPFVGSIVPATDYEYFAHAAPGRRVRELQVGTYVAGTLDRIMPGLFVQGRYAYGFAEQILDIPHNRSQLGLELGYFVTPSVRLIGMFSGQRTHGGVDLSLTSGRVWPAERFRNHDRIVAEHYANVGGGLGWTVNDTVDVFGSLAKTVAGRNTHKMHYGATIGASIRLRKPAADPFSASRREGLVRCVCQKTAGGRMMGG